MRDQTFLFLLIFAFNTVEEAHQNTPTHTHNGLYVGMRILYCLKQLPKIQFIREHCFSLTKTNGEREREISTLVRTDAGVAYNVLLLSCCQLCNVEEFRVLVL